MQLINYNIMAIKRLLCWLCLYICVFLQTDYFGDELRVPCADVLIVVLLAEHHG